MEYEQHPRTIHFLEGEWQIMFEEDVIAELEYLDGLLGSVKPRDCEDHEEARQMLKLFPVILDRFQKGHDPSLDLPARTRALVRARCQRLLTGLRSHGSAGTEGRSPSPRLLVKAGQGDRLIDALLNLDMHYATVCRLHGF